ALLSCISRDAAVAGLRACTLGHDVGAIDLGWRYRLAWRLDRHRPAGRSTRSARSLPASQERHRRAMRLAQVGPRPVLCPGHVLAHGKSISLVRLSVHHQNIGVFMTHDLEAHVPIPPAALNSREAWRAGA